MSWRVDILPEAEGDIKGFSPDVRKRVLGKIRWMAQHFDYLEHKSLKGEFGGLQRLRVGDWRVIYGIDHAERVITVHRAGHRRDVYQ